MKESGGIEPLILNPSTKWRWVTRLTSRPKSPGTHWLGPTSGLDVLENKKIILHFPSFERLNKRHRKYLHGIFCLRLILSDSHLHVKLWFASVGIKAFTAFSAFRLFLRRKRVLIFNNKLTGFEGFTFTWFCTCREDSLFFATFLREEVERQMATTWH